MAQISLIGFTIHFEATWWWLRKTWKYSGALNLIFVDKDKLHFRWESHYWALLARNVENSGFWNIVGFFKCCFCILLKPKSPNMGPNFRLWNWDNVYYGYGLLSYFYHWFLAPESQLAQQYLIWVLWYISSNICNRFLFFFTPLQESPWSSGV